ncbi:MAG: AAA family ATPase [Candidatus Hydrogenedentes bacterium]|nr:AAA family ATPase [Candidatus Hydrogenedentota bacterium]
MRNTLTDISLQGFKTFADMAGDHAFEVDNLNVLIGPNGAGKSNFISFFRLLGWVMAGKLQEHIGRQGGASRILSDGPGKATDISAHLQLKTDSGENEYAFRLTYAADDTLIFVDEKFRFNRPDLSKCANWTVMPVGQREAQLVSEAEAGNLTARVIRNLLRRIVVYQFHNTSETARIRGKWDKDDDRYLKEDGANLASVLFRLKNEYPVHYSRIVNTIQLVLPFFEDFELEPEFNSLLLRWREKFSDRIFSASQAADGMLRIMALVTLLLLPEEDLPDVLVLDEPELGLHPAAIGLLGGLIRSVSTEIQVILATQSPLLVDCFQPGDVVVVDRGYDGLNAMRVGRYSRLRRLDRTSLQDWLDEYSLAELWEKNVLGGRP